MNQSDVEHENLIIMRRAADRIARALCEGARRHQSKKQMLATLTDQVGPLRVRCPACSAEVSVLLGRDDARHLCVVARRRSFLSLRRRLDEQFQRARLTCPSCTTRAKNPIAEEGLDATDDGPREGGDAAAGVACGTTEGRAVASLG